MGGQETKPSNNGQLRVHVNHPKFQMVKLKKQGKSQLMEICLGVEEKQYEEWKLVLQKSKLDGEFLLIPRNDEFSRKGLCGNSGTVQITYDNYSYLLTEQIYNRKGKKSKFEEWQLWYLLFILSAAQIQMKQRLSSKIGDVRPHNIFINQDGIIKVSHLHSWPRESSNFIKAFDNEKTFLAPQEMSKLQMGGLEDTTNYHSEIFSIGLTVLSAATLTDFTDLYNIKTFQFNFQQADQYLSEWRTNNIYSEIFTAFISNLCSFSPQKRLTQLELWNWIKQYEDQIRKKEDFIINQAPFKIQQEINEIRSTYPVEVEPQYIQPQQHYQVEPQQHYVINNNNQIPQQSVHKSLVHSYIPPPHLQGYENLPPQVINYHQSYQNPVGSQNYSPQIVHQGRRYSELPPFGQVPISQGGTYRQNMSGQFEQVGHGNHNNLSYFQNLVDPQGGRIQQTMYIQKPQQYSNIVNGNRIPTHNDGNRMLYPQ